MSFKFNAILNFASGNADAELKKTSKGWASFQNNLKTANSGLAKIGPGIQSSALALAPLTLGLGLAVKESMDFESGLAAVQSVMLATKEEMIPLENITKQLGATTKFTALEATEGAKFLAQAGFDSAQIMAALPAVLDAAAASEMGLGETADLVASQLGAFGLNASEAARVADTLALASSLTNTDMTQLGEGMKYASATARTVGMSISETATAIGIMSNAGVKGSMAGTALKNALLKLADPTKATLEFFNGQDGFNQAVLDASGNLLPFEVIMANVSKVVSQSANPLQAAAASAEIFGLRGTAAYGAYTGQMLETVVVTDTMAKRMKLAGETEFKIGDKIPKLVALRFQMNGAITSAKEMARIRLDNLKGQLILLGSATSGVAIEIGSMLTGTLKGGVATATDALSTLAIGLQMVSKSPEEQAAALESLKVQKNMFADMLPGAIEFSTGVRDGFNSVKETGKAMFESIKEFIKPFIKDGDISVKSLGEFAAQFVLIGSIAAPILGGIMAAFFILGPVVSMISGIFTVVGAVMAIAFSPVTLLVVGVGVALYALLGGIDGIKTAVVSFGEGFMTTFDPILTVLIDELTPTFDKVKEAGMALFNTLFGSTQASGDGFKSFGETVGTVAGFMLTALIPVVDFVAGFLKIILDGINGLAQLTKGTLEFFGLIGTEEDLPGPKKLSVGDGNFFKDQEQSIRISNQSDNVIPIRPPNPNSLLNSEQLRQTSMVQPPSATNIANSVYNRNIQHVTNNPNANKSSEQQVIKVVVEGRISGNDLNLVQTRSEVEQSQLNGRSVSPIDKRRSIQNGKQLGR